jgi:hypothetical protein
MFKLALSTVVIYALFLCESHSQEAVQYNYVFKSSAPFSSTAGMTYLKDTVLKLPDDGGPTCRLPDPLKIEQVWMWREYPAVGFPMNAYGSVSVAVDPGSRYGQSADFPANQFEEPYYLKTIGFMNTSPRTPRAQLTNHSIGIDYSKSRGDSLVFAYQAVNPGADFMMYMGVVWKAPCNPNPAAGAVSIYQTTNTGAVDSSAGVAIRSIIPSGGVAGTEVRVTITSLASYMSTGHLTIGIRDGATANMKAIPVEALFGMQPGYILAPFSRQKSNWIPLVKSAADELLINVDMFYINPTDNKYNYSNTGNGAYYSYGVPSSFSAVMGGAVQFIASKTYIVSEIEIR